MHRDNAVELHCAGRTGRASRSKTAGGSRPRARALFAKTRGGAFAHEERKLLAVFAVGYAPARMPVQETFMALRTTAPRIPRLVLLAACVAGGLLTGCHPQPEPTPPAGAPAAPKDPRKASTHEVVLYAAACAGGGDEPVKA
jgi:hypothetical protein